MIRHGTFRADQLRKLGPEWCYVLASGGPLMRVVTVEGDNALVEWKTSGRPKQRLLPLACLRKAVRLTTEDVAKFRGPA